MSLMGAHACVRVCVLWALQFGQTIKFEGSMQFVCPNDGLETNTNMKVNVFPNQANCDTNPFNSYTVNTTSSLDLGLVSIEMDEIHCG